MSEFNVGGCKDNEVIKEIFKEYSQIEGAESCFVSFDKELADLDGYYKGGALLLGSEDGIMRFLGNIIWILCGGLLSAMGWWIVGLLWAAQL